MEPTASGKIIADLGGDGRQTAHSRVTWAAPTGVRRATKYEDALLTTYATTNAHGAASAPNTAAMGNLTDLDVRIKASHATWTPTSEAALMAKYTGTAGQYEWSFVVSTTGYLKFYWSTDGTALRSATATALASSMVAGRPGVFRVTFQSNDGTGVSSTRFWQSTDEGKTWTEVGTAVKTGTVTTIVTGTNPLVVGGTGSAGGGSPFTGNIYWAEARKGLDGTVMGRVDFTDGQFQLGDANPINAQNPTPTYRDTAGNTWSLLNSTVIRGQVKFSDPRPYVDKPALPAAATDAATTQALANSIRQALIDLGLTT